MSEAFVGRTSSELHVFALNFVGPASTRSFSFVTFVPPLHSYPSYLGYFVSSSSVGTSGPGRAASSGPGQVSFFDGLEILFAAAADRTGIAGGCLPERTSRRLARLGIAILFIVERKTMFTLEYCHAPVMPR